MYKIYIIFTFVAALIFCSITGFNRGGTILLNSDGSGARGGGGCSCHNQLAVESLEVTLELDSAGTTVTNYYPGKSYLIKLTGKNKSGSRLPKFGFRLSVVKGDKAGTLEAVNAGNISATALPESCQYTTIGNFHVVEHKSRINATSGDGGFGSIYEESIPWTAPESGTGPVKLYGVILAVNDDKKETGDRWNKSDAEIGEGQLPESITGVTSICVKTSTKLHATKVGGTWTSSDPAVAYINTAGMVTGKAPGTATITYSLNGQELTADITINGMPVVGSITGKESVCAGSMVQWSNTASGGVWSSSNDAVARVSESGEVIGVAEGQAIITYKMDNSCGSDSKTKTVIVARTPNAGSIAASKSDYCVGSRLKLTANTPGGEWVSGSDIAGVSGGVGSECMVTGNAAGTAVVYYTLRRNNCISKAEKELTFYDRPDTASISCSCWFVKVAEKKMFSATTPGGYWNIPGGQNYYASITRNGELMGLKAGTATVYYTVSNGTCESVSKKDVKIVDK